MTWPGFRVPLSVALALSVAVLSACGAQNAQKEPAAMIAAAYPHDPFVSCREVDDLRKSSFSGEFSVIRCVDKKPSAAILHDLSLDTNLVRRHDATICFWVEDDLVGVHGYGYPDDSSLSKKLPCQPIHD